MTPKTCLLQRFEHAPGAPIPQESVSGWQEPLVAAIVELVQVGNGQELVVQFLENVTLATHSSSRPLVATPEPLPSSHCSACVRSSKNLMAG